MRPKRDRNQMIVRLAARGWSLASIGRRFGVSRQRVDQIVQPKKQHARQAMKAALDKGQIARAEACEDCGSRGPVHGHHDDYEQPLEVEWLCAKCHAARHPTESGRPRRRRRVLVACPTCGTERRMTPAVAERRAGYCSYRCAGKAARQYSDDELLQYLRDLAAKVGTCPTSNDINADPSGPAHNSYYHRFGSLTEAHRLAGLEGLRARRNPRRDYTRQEVRSGLRKLAGVIGRTPTAADIHGCDYLPGPGSVIYRFGSLSAAQEAAGLVPNKQGERAQPLRDEQEAA